MKHFALAACVLALLALAGARAAEKTDVSGQWDITIESPNGTFHPAADFKQEGEKLSGTYKGSIGEGKLEGSVKENKIEWKVKLDYQGQPFVLSYKGTIDGNSMKGSVELGEMGTADWTAKRKAKE